MDYTIHNIGQRIRGFLKWYALYKFTFYFLTVIIVPSILASDLVTFLAAQHSERAFATGRSVCPFVRHTPESVTPKRFKASKYALHHMIE